MFETMRFENFEKHLLQQSWFLHNGNTFTSGDLQWSHLSVHSKSPLNLLCISKKILDHRKINILIKKDVINNSI